MDESKKEQISDLVANALSVVLWAGAAFAVNYFFPGSNWAWYVAGFMILLPLILKLIDLVLSKSIKKLLK